MSIADLAEWLGARFVFSHGGFSALESKPEVVGSTFRTKCVWCKSVWPGSPM